MQAWHFEQQVFDVEGIRIVVRAPFAAEVTDFPYQRCASGSIKLSDWLENRIKRYVGDFEVTVINGRGEIYPHGNTHLATIRDSYAV